MPGDFTQATEVTPQISKWVDDTFEYKPWDDEQTYRGVKVREALAAAAKAIIANVPVSPARTRALTLLIRARMDANAAITHGSNAL